MAHTGTSLMRKNMLDNIPIHNKARDKAWEALIKNKKAKHYLGEGFPLERGFYEIWCISWEKAWQEGFDVGADVQQEMLKVGGTD